jgi:glyceraldehyde-3-phosphate dehydrogenase/erythrose-4-phosphate dehydrogenase
MCARHPRVPIMTWSWSAINDLGDAKANALLFKRDSVHGNFNGDGRG